MIPISDSVRKVFREELLPLWGTPPKYTVSEWADANRQLSRESSARAGSWKTRAYQREPMDAFTDPLVHTIVLMVARQTLKTEVINNALGYTIDQDPGPSLIVQFRDTDCKKFSKIRLSPMLRDTPCLRGKVSEVKSKSSENTFDYKAFPGGHLSIVASASPGNLAALPIRYLYCDEIDKYPTSAGPAGDPIALAQGRQEEFWNRKTILACTPTIDGKSRIQAAWLESDQREYEIPCPFCGHFQITKWMQVRWDSTLPRHKQPESARYYCEQCDQPWTDGQRWNAIRAGRYRATAPFNGVAGFRVSGICRLGTKLSALADEWLACSGNIEARKTFINEQLAETWKEKQGELLDWKVLLDRRERYPVGRVPAGGLVLTAGVDVQRADGGRLEVEVVAWGENRESWSVDYQIFYGDPASPEVWGQLESLLHRCYPHELGGDLQIERMFVDSGDGAITGAVYRWVQTQPRPIVWAIKGDVRSESPVGAPKAVESAISGRRIMHGIVFRVINPSFFKPTFYADLKRPWPTAEERSMGAKFPEGACHFPDDITYGDEHFRQICSEQYAYRKSKQGGEVGGYEQIRPRNESLDCRIYAQAAAWDLKVYRFQDSQWRSRRERVKVRTEQITQTPKPAPQRTIIRSSWMG